AGPGAEPRAVLVVLPLTAAPQAARPLLIVPDGTQELAPGALTVVSFRLIVRAAGLLVERLAAGSFVVLSACRAGPRARAVSSGLARGGSRPAAGSFFLPACRRGARPRAVPGGRARLGGRPRAALARLDQGGGVAGPRRQQRPVLEQPRPQGRSGWVATG